MADRNSLTTIDQIVRRLLFKEGKNNDDYLRYKQEVCDGLRNMHIHDFNVVATKVVTPDPTTKSFDYPEDYVRYESISAVFGGQWWTYTKNKNIVPLKDDDDTEIQSSMSNIADSIIQSGYASGGGINNFYFDNDDKNRRFIVSGFDADIVVLRYITNGLNTTGDILVPDYAVLALEAWVKWRMSAHNNDPVYQRKENENDYKNFRLDMRRVLRPSADEIYDAIYKSTGQGARR